MRSVRPRLTGMTHLRGFAIRCNGTGADSRKARFCATKVSEAKAPFRAAVFVELKLRPSKRHLVRWRRGAHMGKAPRSKGEHGAPEKARAKRKQKPQTFKVRRSALHKQNDARQMTARFLPTRSKISRARSRSARLCVAVTMVRKRA